MTRFSLFAFWFLWLADVFIALLSHRELTGHLFGRNAGPPSRAAAIWAMICLLLLMILWAGVHFKNKGQSGLAIGITASPVVILLPYVLWMAAVLIMGKNTDWR